MHPRIEEFFVIDSRLRIAAEQNKRAASETISSVKCSNGTLRKAMCLKKEKFDEIQ